MVPHPSLATHPNVFAEKPSDGGAGEEGEGAAADGEVRCAVTVRTLHPTPYTLYHTPKTLHPTPYTPPCGYLGSHTQRCILKGNPRWKPRNLASVGALRAQMPTPPPSATVYHILRPVGLVDRADRERFQ